MNISAISSESIPEKIDPAIFFTVDTAPVPLKNGTSSSVLRWWQLETRFDAGYSVISTKPTQSSGHYAYDSGLIVSHNRDLGDGKPTVAATDFAFGEMTVIGFTGSRNLLGLDVSKSVKRISFSRLASAPFPNSAWQMSNINYTDDNIWLNELVRQIIPSHNSRSNYFFTLRENGEIYRHTASSNSSGLAGVLLNKHVGIISIALIGAQDNVLLALHENGSILAYFPGLPALKIGAYPGAKQIFATRAGVLYIKYENRMDVGVVRFDVVQRKIWKMRNVITAVDNLPEKWFNPKIMFSHPHEQLSESYCWPISINAGESTQVYASSSSTNLSIAVKKCSFSTDASIDPESLLNNKKISMELVGNQLNNQSGMYQSTPEDSFQNGCQWRSTAVIRTDPADSAGLYFVEHSDSQAATSSNLISNGIFIVRGNPSSPKPVKVLFNTHTWAAYNYWGGRSGYQIMDYDSPQSTIDGASNRISLRRPFVQSANFTHGLIAPVHEKRSDTNSNGWRRLVKIFPEIYTLQWLRENGIEADVVTDEDLHASGVPLGTKLLVLTGHPEYWSKEQYDKIKVYLDTGGNMINLGGNHCFSPVFLANDGSWFKFDPAQTDGLNSSPYVYKKFFSAAPTEGREAYAFDDGISRRQAKLFGNAYSVKGFNTWAGYKVTSAGAVHRFFTGLGIPGSTATNLLTDSVYARYGIFGGGSGRELDTCSDWPEDEKPSFVQILSKGLNDVNLDIGAELAYHERIGGGWVLSFGSNSFSGTLGIDSYSSAIVMNAVLDALQ